MTRAARKSKPATAEDYAAADYGVIDFQGWKPPSNDEWRKMVNPDLINIRLAYIICSRTKAQNVEALRRMDDETFLDFCGGIRDIAKYLKSLAEMLEAAELRLLIAASAIEVADDLQTGHA